MTTPAQAPGRSHFKTLDGFRGLAALAVVAHHLLSDLGSPLGASTAYLAVDFFFVLSGLVIAMAYERQILQGTLSLKKFVGVRLIRLYPLIAVGAVIGIAWRLVEGRFPITAIVASGAFAFLLLPVPRISDPSANSFPINGPGWSLTYELFVNILFASLVRHISDRVLLVAIVVAGALDIYMANVHHGLLAAASWSGQPAAFIRALAPFLIGVMLYRRLGGTVSQSTRYSVASALVLVALLSAPRMGFLYDVTCALVVFPLVVAVGRHDPSSPGLQRFWSRLGDLSYPIYALNQPIIFFLHSTLDPIARTGPMGMLTAFAIGATVIIVIGQAMFVLYDVPVRRWLNQQMKRVQGRAVTA